jgi:hypothetical protein
MRDVAVLDMDNYIVGASRPATSRLRSIRTWVVSNAACAEITMAMKAREPVRPDSGERIGSSRGRGDNAGACRVGGV